MKETNANKYKVIEGKNVHERSAGPAKHRLLSLGHFNLLALDRDPLNEDWADK